MNMLYKHPHSRCSSARGFTLVELMIAVAIIGILAAIAMPNFSESIKRYRVNAIRDDITASMQLARITAMSRGVSVFLVRNATCTGVTFSGTNDWSCGWRVVADTNRNGNVNVDPTDQLLQTSSVPAGFTLIHNGTGAGTATINQWGQFAGTGHNFLITSAPYGTNDPTSITCITSGGRVRHIKDTLTCP
ncbi:MAG: GspH/FimT family pseudopilin [Burkholderiaceae bacterium]